jgi:hypothetical protein
VGEKLAFRLGKGWIHDAETIYLYGTTREANDRDEGWSIGLRRAGGEWGYWMIDHRVCGICTLREIGGRVVISAGMDGSMQISDADGMHDTVVDASDDAPNDLRNITAIRTIGEDVFAIGMSRMVYRRSRGSLNWSRMDDGMRLRTGTSQLAGIKAIDGDGHGRFLAAGFFGEIWLFENEKWQQIDSPTNVKLEAIRWVNDDLVFIAGASGILLYGPPNELKLIQEAEAADTFWSIEWFRAKLYLATGKGTLYVFDGNRFQRQDLRLPRGFTTGNLHAADGLLLSVGSRDAVLFDGTTWRPLVPHEEGAEFPFDWTIT